MHRLDIKRLAVEMLGWLLLGAALAEWWSRTLAAGAPGYINADIVQIPAVVEDVLFRGNPMAHSWLLTPAPYFFPDGVLYLTMRVLLGKLELAQLTASGLQPVCLALAARQFMVRVVERPQAAALGPALVALSMAFGLLGHAPYDLLVVPAYHTGVAIVATASTAVLWRYASSGGRVTLGLLSATSFAGGLSDALLLVGPAAASSTVLLFTFRRLGTDTGWRAWVAGGVLAVSTSGGFLTLRALPVPRHPQLAARLSQLPQIVHQAWLDWQAFDGWSRAWLMIGLAALTLLAVRSSSGRVRATSATLALSTLYTLIAILLSANLNDAGWIRYLLWPAFSGLLGLAMVGATARWSQALMMAGCAAVVAVAVNPATWTLRSPPDFALRSEVACVDALAQRENAHVVVGQYWVTKPVTLLSRAGVRVAQVEPDLHGISLWLTSRAWFYPLSQTGLLITNRLEPGPVEALGPDFEPVTCGTFQLRVYRGASRERLESFLARHTFNAIGGPP